MVEVWRSAVIATHDFLAPHDRAEIEASLIPSFFPQVDLYLAEVDGHVAGFAGVAGEMLEMLFVSASHHGEGVGSALLQFACHDLGAMKVDVNEANTDALGFYTHRGFTVVGRSNVDGQGKAYPLLHLQKAVGST